MSVTVWTEAGPQLVMELATYLSLGKQITGCGQYWLTYSFAAEPTGGLRQIRRPK